MESHEREMEAWRLAEDKRREPKQNKKNMKTKYPKLETIYVNECCKYEIVERAMAKLQKNQEKIYALMQEVNDRLKNMEPFIFK